MIGAAVQQALRDASYAVDWVRDGLMALSLQAQRLAEADMPAEARERLATLRQGMERGRGLLDLLLSLARAQAASEAPQASVSVQAIFRRVLEDLMPLPRPGISTSAWRARRTPGLT